MEVALFSTVMGGGGGTNFVLPSGYLLLLLDTSDMDCISNAGANGGGEEWLV